MRFNLSKYSDLGRCSYGTLKDYFDTELDEIYDNDKKVNINSVEDLFPYLWQSPGIGVHCEGKSRAYFIGGGTHWHDDFDESIAKYDKDIEALRKKADKSTIEKKKIKYKKDLEDTISHNDHLKALVARLDREMEEQKRLLIEDNR